MMILIMGTASGRDFSISGEIIGNKELNARLIWNKTKLSKDLFVLIKESKKLA